MQAGFCLDQLRRNAHSPAALAPLFADVLEGEVEAASRILLDASRNADAARISQAFEAGRNVDAVAKDVAVLDDDVANVDADAELDAAVGRQRGVARSDF